MKRVLVMLALCACEDGKQTTDVPVDPAASTPTAKPTATPTPPPTTTPKITQLPGSGFTVIPLPVPQATPALSSLPSNEPTKIPQKAEIVVVVTQRVGGGSYESPETRIDFYTALLDGLTKFEREGCMFNKAIGNRYYCNITNNCMTVQQPYNYLVQQDPYSRRPDSYEYCSYRTFDRN